MEEQLKKLLPPAKEKIQPYGLKLTGLHYFTTKPNQRSQKKRKCLSVCFDAITNNINFFGSDYENWRRVQLVELAYEIGFDFLSKVFPDFEIWLDFKISLAGSLVATEPFSKSQGLKEKSVDVTNDNDVYFVPLAELLAKGEIEEDCTLDQYCRRYGLDMVLKHGWHCISPDNSSVEALEAIFDVQKVESVLEIGSGVGICGVAAQRQGIEDFTFVDSSPTVCEYLRGKFPSYKVNQSNVFEFNFERKWDVALIGIPYELNPWFLEQKGWSLVRQCKVVIFQSACVGFFQHENDWIHGIGKFEDWPWWSGRQTVRHYFENSLQFNFEWQTCIVATHSELTLNMICGEMLRRGFSCSSEYKYIKL